jgi:hypothetical protein
MAAPTNAAFVKKVLANSEPSTHGPELTSPDVRHESEMRSITDLTRVPFREPMASPFIQAMISDPRRRIKMQIEADHGC